MCPDELLRSILRYAFGLYLWLIEGELHEAVEFLFGKFRNLFAGKENGPGHTIPVDCLQAEMKPLIRGGA